MPTTATKRRWAPVKAVVWPPANYITPAGQPTPRRRVRFITRKPNRINGTNEPKYQLCDVKIDKTSGRLAIVHQAQVGDVFLGGHVPNLREELPADYGTIRGLPMAVPWPLEGTVVLIRPISDCILS